MKLERILIEFGYKITKYDICGASGVCEENGICEASGVCGESGVYWKSVWDAVDSANVAIKNNRRVNRVILFFGKNDAVDCADSANKKSAESTKSILRNLLQNGVEIVVFLKNCTEAQSAFWRTFGIVYLLK